MNEYVLGLIISLLGGLLYYRVKSSKYQSDALIGRTEGREEILKKQQEAYRKQREEIDAGIAKAKAELARRENKKLTDQERADKWEK